MMTVPSSAATAAPSSRNGVSGEIIRRIVMASHRHDDLLLCALSLEKLRDRSADQIDLLRRNLG